MFNRNVTGKEHQETPRQSKLETSGFGYFVFAVVLFDLFFLA